MIISTNTAKRETIFRPCLEMSFVAGIMEGESPQIATQNKIAGRGRLGP
ncbi:MAG: hypothetical protein IIB00_03985 [candidate division Zixibacteria bacterium]|nr:hypothetical protein [candidate division Zixibacteria bacterium]